MHHRWIKKLVRRTSAAILAGLMLLSTMPNTFAQETVFASVQSDSAVVEQQMEQKQEFSVVADWKFGQEGVKSGTIAEGNLVIKDQTGNGNDLKMQVYNSGNQEEYVAFSQNSMTGQGGSMVFNGENSTKTGVDFITVDGAPINANEFKNGYTMEFLYYFPEDWTAADQWMSLIGRQGSGGGNPEGEQGTMYASISNCKEVQFITGNAEGNHTMDNAAWSVSMDEGGVWYHIAIVSDGSEIATYVNGCEAFRDYVNDAMDGMYADPNDGRFRIGSSWWDGLDKFLQGSLQEIRITDGALQKSDWLVPNPEDYVGEFGSNETYTLRNEDNYNIVLIPDTQNTIEYRADVMDTAIDELIESADSLNIEAVVHLGDVVDDSIDAVQYNNAKDIFYQLPEAGVKFLIQPGNHDNWSDNGSSYWHYFGQDSEAYMALTSSYLTAKAWSGAMFVNAGSYTYMIISLANEGGKTSWNPSSGELEWFESMLQQYPNCPTIVTRHDIQNCSDTQPSAIQLSKEGQKLWDIVKKYPQVFMMVGGHSHGSGVEILQNDQGQDVISILTDLQFSYNGGNGWFRYLEFDENADKIYYSIYSPYAASLNESEKSFFDVNFLTGPGHEGEVTIDFKTRFAGMANEQPEAQTEGKWMTGEYHSHTIQSSDASEPYITMENALNAAFREDLDTMPEAAKVDNIKYGQAFDYFMLADHLRNSPRNPDGSENATARWSAIGAQVREIEKLQISGKYKDKFIYTGFEWDMMNLDHASVALLDDSGDVPIEGIRAFEWLFSYGTSEDSFYSNEEAVYGPRQNDKNDVNDTYVAVKWVAENYPGSFILPNHPSRHNNGNDVVDNGEVTIEHLRTMNDIAPDVVFGFEGMPGNQLDPACELPADDLRAGADEMISVTGGVWDALLSEGRRFYNFTNSDFHFKISSNQNYSSGYWASEFSRNWTWVEPGEDQQFKFSDVVEGLRSGNSYAVNGELISDLTFTVADTEGNNATMGQDLNVTEGQDITVTIRFKVPEYNNYQSLYNTDTGINVDNTPDLDHVDLIMGHVTGKVDTAEYSSTANTDAKIVASFDKEQLAKALREDGYYTLTYTTVADSDMYFRVRGLSSSEVDENGDPVTHEREVTTERPARFDYINDYNYSHLSFYANPVWINVSQASVESVVEVEGLGEFTSLEEALQAIENNSADAFIITLNKDVELKGGKSVAIELPAKNITIKGNGYTLAVGDESETDVLLNGNFTLCDVNLKMSTARLKIVQPDVTIILESSVSGILKQIYSDTQENCIIVLNASASNTVVASVNGNSNTTVLLQGYGSKQNPANQADWPIVNNENGTLILENSWVVAEDTSGWGDVVIRTAGGIAITGSERYVTVKSWSVEDNAIADVILKKVTNGLSCLQIYGVVRGKTQISMVQGESFPQTGILVKAPNGKEGDFVLDDSAEMNLVRNSNGEYVLSVAENPMSTETPTTQPTTTPSIKPTEEPTVKPTIEPTTAPTNEPSATTQPTVTQVPVNSNNTTPQTGDSGIMVGLSVIVIVLVGLAALEISRRIRLEGNAEKK